MNTQLPIYPEPYWRDPNPFQSYFRLKGDSQTDVVVIGAGIAGITTAYLLSKEGKKVILLDAGKVGNGTTGHTTAKITAQHDVIYDELIQHFGSAKAEDYYQANMKAKKFIEDTIQQLAIDCDFKQEDAYLYTIEDANMEKLEKEAKAYETLGIKGAYVDKLPLDLGQKAGLIMPNQAQFHPLRYLRSLLDQFIASGGQVFENTTVVDVEEGQSPAVITRDQHRIHCKQVVICSHFPCYDKGGYFARLHADRSYVLAIKPEKSYPGGMYLSIDNPATRSLREVTIHGEQYVLVGGQSHKTGKGVCTMEHYEILEKFAKDTLGIKEYPYRWSAQDLITLDKVPYIGRLTAKHENIFVATGFRKWGMSHSTVSALLITDLIMERDNPYEALYDPSRFQADPSLRTLIVENLDVAGSLVAGKVGLTFKEPADLNPDEGAIVMVGGEKCGAYRDVDGALHVVDATCTHLGCEVEWNHGDRTWDCPCHGSRYSTDGEVIEGPAEKPLAPVTVESGEQ
ncbi:FAD-dependent oxidoreductase [Shimazuella alba]|uniref:FAD-dependent oxidoreductase n=1 Tax=Shimazuella alba TaxID=2690964 RepID=A0A6I4VZD7_9BACL|nr:FAD-dependent oxidoreductase [Shimazuella alba]MXQ55908.1 FAD-dependent oxidoreductase [Shimazuella alba]